MYELFEDAMTHVRAQSKEASGLVGGQGHAWQFLKLETDAVPQPIAAGGVPPLRSEPHCPSVPPSAVARVMPSDA